MSQQIMAYLPPQLPPATSETAQNQPQPSPSIPEHYMYKNQLQQYLQKLSLPLPVYQAQNEGVPHAPFFRATVFVDNTSYTSENVFKNRKSAEQDVAKIALHAMMQKVKDEGSPFIHEDAIFCKAVMNDYAAKLHLDLPTYQTTQQQEGLPIFASSVVFNGTTFTGPIARTKKEAEQLAARTAILSIMGNPGPGSGLISNIVKYKYQPYAGLYKSNGSNNTVVTPLETVRELTTDSLQNKGKEITNTGGTNNVPVIIENCSGQNTTVPVPVPVQNQPFHEFKKPRLEEPTEFITTPITFVPATQEQPQDAGPSSAKKRRKKAKKNRAANSQNVVPSGADLSGDPVNKDKEIEIAGNTSNMSRDAIIGNLQHQAALIRIVNQPFLEKKKPIIETPASLPITPPNIFVPPVNEQNSGTGPCFSKKRRKKGKKNHQTVAQFPNPIIPTSQVPWQIPQ